MTSIPVLLITGPLGVGKTAVLEEVEYRLRSAGVPFAALDLDALTQAYPPAPGDDPYRSALMFQNLAAVWQNFRSAGATRLVCAYVVESRHELDRYREAIPGAAITIVRLRGSDETVQARLSRRVAQGDPASGAVPIEVRERRTRWSARSRELAEAMDRARLEDVLVETDGRDVHAIAADVLRLAGWPGA